MLLLFAILLAVAWVAGFGIFHVTSVELHILIVLAIVSLFAHIIRGRKVT